MEACMLTYAHARQSAGTERADGWTNKTENSKNDWKQKYHQCHQWCSINNYFDSFRLRGTHCRSCSVVTVASENYGKYWWPVETNVAWKNYDNAIITITNNEKKCSNNIEKYSLGCAKVWGVDAHSGIYKPISIWLVFEPTIIIGWPRRKVIQGVAACHGIFECILSHQLSLHSIRIPPRFLWRKSVFSSHVLTLLYCWRWPI